MTEEEIRIWRAGMKTGLTEYASWKDGVEYVGTCGKTLKEAKADVDAGKYDAQADTE